MISSVRSIATLDRILHEPARLMIVTLLSTVDSADFLYLLHQTGLTKGNLSSHLTKLERAGYVDIAKTFQGKIPVTVCRLTEAGHAAFHRYFDTLKHITEDVTN